MKRAFADSLFVSSHNYWAEHVMANRLKTHQSSSSLNCTEVSSNDLKDQLSSRVASSSSLPSQITESACETDSNDSVDTTSGPDDGFSPLSDGKDSMSDGYGYNARDVRGPHHVINRVQLIIRKWLKTIPIDPHLFLMNLLKCRGYEYESIPSLTSIFRR